MLFEIMNDNTEPNKGSSSRALTTRRNEFNSGFGVLNLLDEKQLASAESFLKRYIQSDKSGIKSIQDGLAILARAQDLNLPFSSCAEHIHVINGKTGVDIHIVKSLLLRAGITWECTKDYVPQYQYTDGNTIYLETQIPQYCVKCRTAKEALEITKDDIVGIYPVQWFADLNNRIYNEFEISDKCVKAINRIHAQKLVSEGKFPIIRIPAQPIDFVTEYKFTRYFYQNGKERVMQSIGHFSHTEATNAGLFDKDTYKKYARILISHRAFTFGARDIGDDVLMGCMESGELKIVEDVELTPSDYEIIDENQN